MDSIKGKNSSSGSLQVGPWQVEPALGEIRRKGETRQFEPRVMQVLAYLADRPGQAVSKHELAYPHVA
ncbi:MAG: hypothetical protein V3T83_16170 [Acidobacteriota bacterium]